MNFDEWLKQGLDDSPGGDWDETKVDEVVSAARKRRASGGAPTGGSGAGSVSRRRSAALRTATVAAAAVVVAAGVIGGIVWNGQHAAANKNRNQTGVVNNTTNQVKANPTTTKNETLAPNFNAVVPSTTPTGSNTTNALQMYASGKVTSVEAIAWPGLQKKPISFSTVAPVVQVPFTAAVTTPTMMAPKTIPTSLPVQEQGKLVAYFVQVSQTTSFYLLAPPGLKGKAELAADGSYSVYLHNADASIEVDSSGASTLAADSMAAPFFTAAANAAAQNSQTGVPGPLAPAVISHPNPQTAYFSFRAKNGRDVAGINDYLSSDSAASVRIVYTADAKDWSYAPYVLTSSVNLLNNVLAPQIGGTPVLLSAKDVTIAGKKYSLQSALGNYVSTPAGVAYIMGPQLSRKGSPQDMAWADVPTAPYNIAISAPWKSTNGQSSESTSIPGRIPSVRVLDADNNVYYAYPGGLTLHSNRWLTYSVAWAVPGMNQAASNDLHVLDLRTYKDTLVTSYLVGGGNFFAVGTSGGYLAYDKSYYTYNSVGGTLVHQATVDILSTGQELKLPSRDVIPDKATSSGFAVKFGMGGRVITIPLQGWG